MAGSYGRPTAEWIDQQLTEACDWEAAPKYLIRDRDSVYGAIFKQRLRRDGDSRPTDSVTLAMAESAY